jgi:hypothetical protein
MSIEKQIIDVISKWEAGIEDEKNTWGAVSEEVYLIVKDLPVSEEEQLRIKARLENGFNNLLIGISRIKKATEENG